MTPVQPGSWRAADLQIAACHRDAMDKARAATWGAFGQWYSFLGAAVKAITRQELRATVNEDEKWPPHPSTRTQQAFSLGPEIWRTATDTTSPNS